MNRCLNRIGDMRWENCSATYAIWINWRRFDAELAEEMEFHREMTARGPQQLGQHAAITGTSVRGVGLGLARPVFPGPLIWAEDLGYNAAVRNKYEVNGFGG